MDAVYDRNAPGGNSISALQIDKRGKKQIVFILVPERGVMAGCGGDYAITQKPLKKPVAVIA